MVLMNMMNETNMASPTKRKLGTHRVGGRKVLLVSGTILSLVIIAAIVSSISHATATTISIPSYPLCGWSNFTVTVSAFPLASVTGWQVNFTWATGNLNLTSFSYGNVWSGGTSSSHIIRASSTGSDSALIAYSFNNGATYSNTGSTTLFTATFKPLQKPSSSYLHITTSSDRAIHGLTSLVLNSDTSEQGFTSTDGDWENCILRPPP